VETNFVPAPFLVDQTRIRQLEKKREQERQQFTEQIQKAKKESETNYRDISSKFAARTSTAEDQLKHETIGLVTAEEFRKRKQELQLEGPSLKEAPKRKRENKLQKSKLSFDIEEEENAEGDGMFFDKLIHLLS
jgi:protein FAM50